MLRELALTLGRRRERWLALLAYLAVALYLTSPIISELSTRFLGGESGDVYQLARHIWWHKTTLQSGEDLFYHSLLGYPVGFSAARMWAQPLQFFPMWLFAFVLPLPAAYNLGFLLILALNGWAMYALARRRLLTSRRAPAFFAGLIYMLFPAIQVRLFTGQAGILAQWQLPLLILALFDFADRGGARRFCLAALLFLLATLGDYLQSVTVLAPLAGLFLVARVSRRDYVGAARVALVALLGFILVAAYMSPALPLLMPAAEAGDGIVRNSLDLFSLAAPSSSNALWHDMTTPMGQAARWAPGGVAAYVGFFGACLALLGAFFRRDARWWLLVALVAWLLALGPVLKANGSVVSATIAGYETVVPLPYSLLSGLPAFEWARAPDRFMILFAAVFSIVAGFGAAVCFSSRLMLRRSRNIQLLLMALLSFALVEDYRLFGAFPSVPAAIPQSIESLKLRRDVHAIYNVPHDSAAAAREAMYLQTAHRKPLIAGHEGDLTPVERARLSLLAKFQPSLLKEAGADIVIIHKARAFESGQLDLLHWRARQGLGEPLFEDQRYAVYETPFNRDRAPAVYAPTTDEHSHVTYIYKEQPGWLEFNAILEATNRRVHLTLNDTPLETLQVTGRIPLSIPLPMARRGYHTLRIAPDPPCPERINTSVLRCQRVTVEGVQIKVLSDGAIYDPIRIEDGIILAGYLLPAEAADETVKIRFWWRFEADRSENDVRFVHVLDANGRLAPSSPPDHNFGSMAAGSELTETVSLDKSMLAAGDYRVLTGWYELPQAIRYDVLTDVEGAQDDTVVLGTIRIRE